jgi:hypothetical protein
MDGKELLFLLRTLHTLLRAFHEERVRHRFVHDVQNGKLGNG